MAFGHFHLTLNIDAIDAHDKHLLTGSIMDIGGVLLAPKSAAVSRHLTPLVQMNHFPGKVSAGRNRHTAFCCSPLFLFILPGLGA